MLLNKSNSKGLERFKKNKRQKRVIIGAIIGILLVLGIVKLYKTYAIYEEKKSFNVLQGKIASFSKGDLQLAVYVNDVKVKKVPAKSNLYNVEVDCDTLNSGVSGTWDYNNWTVQLSSLSGKQTPVVCNIKFNPVYKIYIGDSTEKVSDFPTKPTEQAKDYAIETTCDKGVASFDKNTWEFNVTTYEEGMSCDVRFKPMYNITVEGVKSDTFPTKEVATEKSYATKVTCTNGTAKWDKVNWNVNITDGSNTTMKCNVEFYIYHGPEYNITILDNPEADFPEKPTEQWDDYAVTVSNCVNGSATWDKANWQIKVSNEQSGMSCDVKFERMYTITVDSASRTTFPTNYARSTLKGYEVRTNCTNGTGTWDATNWRMTENSNINPTMKCNVDFATLSCDASGTTTAHTGVHYWSNGGWAWNNPPGGGCSRGPCSGNVRRTNSGEVVYFYFRSDGAEYSWVNQQTAINQCLDSINKVFKEGSTWVVK